MKSRLIVLATLLMLIPMEGHPAVSRWKLRFRNNSFSVGLNPHNPFSAYAQGPDGRLFVTHDLGITWDPLGNPGLAQVRQIVVHPSDSSTIFCAAFTGGLRKSTDQGLTWRTVLAGLGIDGESIALDEYHPDTMYAGNFSNGDIFRSTDRGEVWTLRGTVGGSLCGLALRPDNPNILFAGTGGGQISRSEDGGANWELSKSGGSLEIPKIVIDPVNPLVAYATGFAGLATATGMWKTINGGNKWTLTALMASLWAVALDPAHPDTVWGGTFSVEPAQVFRTSNAGATWDTVSQGIPADANAWNLKIHPLNGSAIWLALTSANTQTRGIFRWMSSSTTVEGVVVDASTGDTIRTGTATLVEGEETINLAASGGRFSFSYFEGDSTLTPIVKVVAYPYHTTEVQIQFSPDSLILSNIALLRLETASISGTVLDSLSHSPLHARLRLTASSAVGVMVRDDSTDGTGSYSFDSLFVSEQGVVEYPTLEVFPDFPHPTITRTPPDLPASGLTIPFDPDTADVLVVQATGGDDYAWYYRAPLDSLGVRYSLWDEQQRGPGPFRRALELRKKTIVYFTGNRTGEIAPAERDSLAAAVPLGVHLFVTGQNVVEANDTTSFVRDILGVAHAGNVSPFAHIMGVENELLAGLDISTLGGSGANNQNSRDVLTVIGANTLPVCSYAIGGIAGIRVPSDNGSGRVVLLGFGVESINTGSMRYEIFSRVLRYFTTGVVLGVHNDSGLLPVAFSLEQNYPNPFNPVTVIRYAIPSGAPTSLTLYSVLGKQVAVLFEGFQPAGEHTLTFDGSQLSSGVYYYRLISGGLETVRKCVLIR